MVGIRYTVPEPRHPDRGHGTNEVLRDGGNPDRRPGKDRLPYPGERGRMRVRTDVPFAPAAVEDDVPLTGTRCGIHPDTA